ncbi:MAG: dUTP diphosphatase [Mycobacteriales bacterium]
MTATVLVPIRQLDASLPLPAYAHLDDAGADLVASADVTLAPGERALVPTGIAIAVPAGYAAFVHPRSGLAARCGISMVNAPGTIDSGYRGEILVNLINLDPRSAVEITRGDRIAQLIIQPIAVAVFTPTDQLPASSRGIAGHGSTGGFEPR